MSTAKRSNKSKLSSVEKEATGPVARPHTVRVRMYRVGIGDCFLLTLEYDGPLADGRNERHVLIDFGSFRQPRKPSFPQIAASISNHCRGKLDVIIASHRDRDHIAGFADREACEVLRDLSPSLVVRPWTDDPSDGWSDRRTRSPASNKSHGSVAERASRNLRLMGFKGQLAYLQAGHAWAIERELPGTQVLLMGPPGRDAWKGPVRTVNNTSLILLLTVTNGRHSKCLLFSGDAEICSWSKALEMHESRKLIEKVDLYKIGHHGSQKATPPELLGIWKQSQGRPRLGLLSTEAGVFGVGRKLTEVPSRRLLNDLHGLMNIVSTQQLPPDGEFVEVAARVSSKSTFVVVKKAR